MPSPREKALSLIKRARIAEMSGRLDQARALYKASLSFHPTAEAYTFLGWTYSLCGDLERAIAFCRRAIATDPGLGNPYSDIGAYLIRLDRFNEATFWLRKASRARRYAGYYSAHFNLGLTFEHLGDEARAIDSLRHSLRHCPENEHVRKAYLRLVARTN